MLKNSYMNGNVHMAILIGAFRRGNKPPVLPEEDKKL